MNSQKTDSLLKSFTDSWVPGCALVIMKDNEILYEGYSGYADCEQKKPIAVNSIFRQASTTKLFTYVMGMQLYEEGKFLFTDPLYEYLPEWKNTTKFIYPEGSEPKVVPTEKPITVQEAFNMTCGYPYCMSAHQHFSHNLTLNAMAEAVQEYYEKSPVITIRDEVRACSKAPAMFEPGTHWQYGLGSEIVGAMIEEITGKTVRENMQERLIEPLDLKDTATFLNEEKMQQLVKCYFINEAHEKIPMDPTQDEILKPGAVPMGARANLNCSCRDFAVFMSMLANGGSYKGERILSRASIDLMRTNTLCPSALKDFVSKNGPDILGYGYGLGVRVLMDRAAGGCNGTPGAFGWSGGYGTWAEASPEEKLAIVYMHNTQGERNEYCHMKVRAAAYSLLD